MDHGKSCSQQMSSQTIPALQKPVLKRELAVNIVVMSVTSSAGVTYTGLAAVHVCAVSSIVPACAKLYPHKGPK